MDYFDVFNALASRRLLGETFAREDIDPDAGPRTDDWLIPDTAEEWWEKAELTMPTYEGYENKQEDGSINSWGVAGQSSYDSRSQCATRLKTSAKIQLWREGQDPDFSLVRRGFSPEGIPTLYVPLGTRILYGLEAQDTSGVTTSYNTSIEPSNERAGVDVIDWKLDDLGLDAATMSIMKAERPDLFDKSIIEAFDFTDFKGWWDDVTQTYGETVSRVLIGNYETYFTRQGMERLRGGSGIKSTEKTYDTLGKYRTDIIYGYDWEAEVESQKEGWTLLEGEGFWTRFGYTFLTLSYYVLAIYTIFRATISWAALGAKSGGFWAASLLRKTAMLAFGALEMLTVEYMVFDLPYRILAVDATSNHNNCGFPPNGHYHSYWVNVYDPSKTDSYGTPHCAEGEHRVAVQQNPLKYDIHTPCCAEGLTFDPTQELCIGDDEMGMPGSPISPAGEAVPKEEMSGLQMGSMVMLGVVAVVVVLTMFGSKGDQ